MSWTQNVNVIYDIGANKGQWRSKASKKFPFARIESFEASSLALKYNFHHALLSDSNDRVVNWYERQGTGDSYYKEKYGNAYDGIQPQKRSCCTLDTYVKDKNLARPDYIKIDVQGSELDVLRGASWVLETCHTIDSELPIIGYNQGAPNIQQYLDFFENAGFLPFEILNEHKRPFGIVQIDMRFHRSRNPAK